MSSGLKRLRDVIIGTVIGLACIYFIFFFVENYL